MYSPFLSKSGKSLDIRRVKYHHMEQLRDCDEGHHLEYKSMLEDGGKAQLAKEIASFANCEGGWLIVGIDDKTKEISPIEKIDYSQKVGKIATRITPMPEFDTKFICIPGEKNRGILLIYVYEGKNPPYICNGSIYVRSGSSKEPVKAADRGNVEYLIERSKKFEEELSDFFRGDYLYMYQNAIIGTVRRPAACIYMKNISSKNDQVLYTYKKRKEVVAYILKKYDLFERVQYSVNSIIFLHKGIEPETNGATYIFELFYDWSFKISCPLGFSDSGSMDSIKEYYKELGKNINVESLKMVDGMSLGHALIAGFLIIEWISKKYKVRETDYVCQGELLNAEGYILLLNGKAYKDYLLKHGLPYVQRMTNKTNRIYLSQHPEIKFVSFVQMILLDFIGPAFGYDSEEFIEIFKKCREQYIVNNNL